MSDTNYLRGGSFLLDIPEDTPSVWGDGKHVLWPEGEACMIAGPTGVGKSTLAGQVVRGLLFGDSVLGLPVSQARGRVLYLAMDRPQQIRRNLARQFSEADRARLDDRLAIWPGPPTEDIAKYPDVMLGMAQAIGASHIVVDSIKDAAVGISEDAVGAGYNRARQKVLAAGIQVLELHHNVKRGANGAKPNTLADVYGSTWLTAGAGSVIILHGEAGDSVVEFTHAKQPRETCGPWRLTHDHATGVTSIFESDDPLAVLKELGQASADTFANVFYGVKSDSKAARADRERARRALDALVKRGVATSWPEANPTGGKPVSIYGAAA